VPHHNLANHNDARVLLQNYHALYFAHMQVLMTAAMNAQNKRMMLIMTQILKMK